MGKCVCEYTCIYMRVCMYMIYIYIYESAYAYVSVCVNVQERLCIFKSV